MLFWFLENLNPLFPCAPLMTVPGVSESDSPKATVIRPTGGIFCGLYINPLGQLGPLRVVKVRWVLKAFPHLDRRTRAEFLKMGPIEHKDYSILIGFHRNKSICGWQKPLVLSYALFVTMELNVTIDYFLQESSCWQYCTGDCLELPFGTWSSWLVSPKLLTCRNFPSSSTRMLSITLCFASYILSRIGVSTHL